MPTDPPARSLALRLLMGVAGVISLAAALGVAGGGRWLPAAALFGVGAACLGWSLPRGRREAEQLPRGLLDELLEEHHEAVESSDNRVHCPCCGFPTLYAENADRSCLLCEWDEESANEFVSLSEARRSFARSGSVFPPGRRPPWDPLPPEPEELEAAERLIAAYRVYQEAPDDCRVASWDAVLEAEGELEALRGVRIQREIT